MNVKLSTEAVKALIAVGTNRQGAMVTTAFDSSVLDELQRAGVIGDGLGLTRRGTIARQRLMDAALDVAF